MATTYELADTDVISVLDRMMAKYHKDLTEVELRVCCLMAIPAKNDKGEPLAPAVKLNGYPCQAIIKIISYKDRVAGREDVEITIDADNWEKLSEAERDALIDHELTHIEVQRDDEGTVKADDCGRPKVKMRLHDHQHGWFDVVAKRHGDASAEVKQAKAFADEFGQVYFGWSRPPEHGIETQRLSAEGRAAVEKAMA